ncbi:MAG: hypothetical protein ABL900_03910 [Burkholderiaceae bacterium]
MSTTTQAEIARALGLSKASITKLKARGMPVHSIEAARQWRHQYLSIARCKPEPAPIKTPSPADAVQRVSDLATVAEAALEAGCFDLIAPTFREALRAVPRTHRASVLLPLKVMDELVRPVMELIEPDGSAPAQAMSDEEADAMGRFWYGIAAGERVAVP